MFEGVSPCLEVVVWRVNSCYLCLNNFAALLAYLEVLRACLQTTAPHGLMGGTQPPPEVEGPKRLRARRDIWLQTLPELLRPVALCCNRLSH